MDILELYAVFHGRVQGVCFRATCQRHATDLGLHGTVKNLRDGTVELYAQGPREDLEQLLRRVQVDNGLAQVESVDSEYRELGSIHMDFRILY